MQTILVILPLFGGVGLTEWIVIGLAIMLFFGASKLPKLGQGLGEGIRNFKKGIKGALEEEEKPPVTADAAEKTDEEAAIDKKTDDQEKN